jgi:ketosteroid isomerase-like protein
VAPFDLVDNYRRARRAFNDNDLDAVERLVAPNVVYTFHGEHLAAGEYHGIDGFREVVNRAKELTGGTAMFTPLTVATDDLVLMVWGRFRGTRNGTTLDTMHVYYYRFDDQGRVVEGHTVPVDQHVANAFWS